MNLSWPAWNDHGGPGGSPRKQPRQKMDTADPAARMPDTSPWDFPCGWQPCMCVSTLADGAVPAGSRVGWRWCCKDCHIDHPKSPYYFETNWLNDEPQNGSEEHKEHRESKCVEELMKKRRRLGPFVGMHEPPKTKEVYEELVINYIRNHLRTK